MPRSTSSGFTGLPGPSSSESTSGSTRASAAASASTPPGPAPRRPTPPDPDRAVAVVGLACRFPGGATPAEFWRLLESGSAAIGAPPAGRPGAVDGPPLTGEAPPVGGYLDEVDRFDAEFFGISPREAAAMDPQQRLVLELAWEAVEGAGNAPDALRGSRTGVFVGALADDYATLLRRGGPDTVNGHTLTGLARGIIAGRLSYALGLTGPSMVVDAAQASALVAVQLAVESLRRGESELALAGGVNLNLAPDSTTAVARFGGLSPDGRCFTFDARANGYVRGEGGAVLLLKLLRDAVRDGDRVHCVIRGAAVTNDGASATLPTPTVAGQERAVRAALADAELAPEQVQYVELHGPGTRLGDPIEAAALGAVFAAGRAEDAPLVVGSVKTNIGHLEGASGIAGLVKTVLSIAGRRLVPTLNHRTPNPDIDLAALRLRVGVAAQPWPWPEVPLVAGVSSFGMGGTNCHLVLEEFTAPTAAAAVPPGEVLSPGAPLAWPLSGRDEQALREQAGRLHAYLTEHPDAELLALAQLYATRRTLFEHRSVTVARGRDELLAELALLAEGRPSGGTVEGTHAGAPRRAVFVFPGQGSQWAGMAAGLLDHSPVFARRFAECAAALAPHLDWSPEDVLRDRPGAAELARVDVVQPMLWAVMVSLAEVWRAAGVEPAAVVGHSQGEVAAATVTGALSLADAARIVTVRSKGLLKIAGLGGMVSVPLPDERVRRDIAPWEPELSIAAVNGPQQTVVAGPPDVLERFTATYGPEVRIRKVRVDTVSHCAVVDVFKDDLYAGLGEITPRSSTVPFWSTVTGDVLDTAALDTDYWYRNLRHEVRFAPAVASLLEAGFEAFVEISPHPVLTTGVLQTAEARAREAAVVSTLRRDDDEVRRLLTAFGEAHAHGIAVDWSAVRPAAGLVAPALPAALPTYPFQRRRHWTRVTAAPDGAGVTVPDTRTAESADSADGLAARLAALSPQAALQWMLTLVRDHTAAVLGYAGGDEVRPRHTFKDLGFDSAMTVALRGRLGRAAGWTPPVSALYDHPTPTRLAEYLCRELRAGQRTPQEPPAVLIERLSAALGALPPESGPREEAAERLTALLATLGTPVAVSPGVAAPGPGSGAGGDGTDEVAALEAAVEAAGVEELFELIDSSLS
ncbi:acyltransferase domain-containing protein [Streptomyces sp. NPDC007905]|uniref:type I polyketide synthase n=1 Tax=Streptomyces sp. NPDC007905 TaxID=3364788 RepID=UPI0036E201C4